MHGSLGWNVVMKIAKTFSLMFEVSDWCVQIAHCFRFPFQMPPFVVACHAKHAEDAENVNASVTRTAPTCVHLLFHVRGECCAPLFIVFSTWLYAGVKKHMLKHIILQICKKSTFFKNESNDHVLLLFFSSFWGRMCSKGVAFKKKGRRASSRKMGKERRELPTNAP